MRIAGVQFKPFFGEKEKNVEMMIEKVKSIEADLIIFPELSTSGYFFLEKEEVNKEAEDFNGDVISRFQDLSSEHNKILVIGFPEKSGDKFYNSAAILFPEKEISKCYRKTHLFYKEKFVFSPGDSGFFVVNDKERDVKIGVMICYDWRFPESSRTLALMGADLIVCPSNLVTTVWHNVMPARAIENKVYFAVINRIGKENRNGEELFFNGESAIYGYNGERLAKAGVEDEKIIFADITPSSTRKKSFNEFNDVFKDRRPDLYKL
ncbi:MAG: nitrilase-related carbon-nitrogen hydrolase [bacterium]